MNAFERWQKANAERAAELRQESERRARWQQMLAERQRAIPMRGRAHMQPTIAGTPIVVDPLVPSGEFYLIDPQYLAPSPEPDPIYLMNSKYFTPIIQPGEIHLPDGGIYGGAGASADWSLPGESSNSSSDSGSSDSSGEGGGSNE